MRSARRVLARLLPLGVALAAAAAAEPAAQQPALRAGVFDPPRPAPELSLEASDGGTLTLSRYRGKVVILGFGFSSCPDVCPTTLSVLARARRELGAEGDQVQVVYVTVDPARDDAKRLREYLTGFDPGFVGGTGSEEQLAAVRKQYGIAATRQSFESGYAFAHSSYTVLIDRAGNLRALMPYGHSADDYVHDMRILLAR